MEWHVSTKNNSTGIHPLEQLKQSGQDGQDVKIGIIDGAIDTSHELLTHIFNKNKKQLTDYNNWHGTAVCSIIAGSGIGIAEKSTIYHIPVFQVDPQGTLRGCSELKLAKAINQAREQGCHIINVSGASLSVNGRGSDQLRQAVEACQREGVLIVAAVGNENRDLESLPAALDSVLAVGACQRDGTPAKFNNHGRILRRKMILAPGIDIPVALADNDISFVCGSSFAAPVITGIAALLFNALSLQGKKDAPETIRKLLFETATILPPVHVGKYFFNLPRLNLASLWQRVACEFTPTKPNRNIIMPTEEINILPAAEVHDAPVTNIIEAAHNDSSPISALTLPTINDAASHNFVHMPTNVVAPQASSDVHSERYEEKVFLIGTLGYDFGTEARLDYFTQVMGNKKAHPFDPVQMATHLTTDDNIEQSDALIWVLKVDGIPVYAIKPDSQFSVLEYARMVEFLHDQETKGVERVSIAAVVSGEIRLFNGQFVPTVRPVLRGMFNWRSHDLAKLVLGENTEKTKNDQLINFINRIYYELRNRGYDSNERAINYAATNAYQMREIFDDAFAENLFLNQISAVPSPVARPESDCWDVVLEFFNPKERLTVARKLYRYTVDVSDIMPVTIGTLRSWYAY